jgi:glucose/arabinose dehydrogenase
MIHLIVAGFGLAGTLIIAACSSTAHPATTEAVLNVEMVVDGLDTPWAIDFAQDGRTFITERGGRIRIVRDERLLPDPWAKLPAVEFGESGLLGIALDPDFARNHFVYVAFTYREGGQFLNQLVRMRDDPETNTGTLDKVLFERVPGGPVHDGGRVKFGPDGKLYWTMGVGSPSESAQNPASFDGKILRLNPDGTIPPDNPFPDSPVYAYGLRNPQGLAWQPGTGLLYATDHGPSGRSSCCRDEINLIEPGLNYGWPVIRGDQTREGMVSPIVHSGESVTWAPSGAAFVTQGPWAGSLLFTGLRGQAVYRATLDPTDAREVESLETLLQSEFGRLRDVVEGPDGAIYVLTSNLDGRGTPPPDGDKLLRLTFGP